MKPFPKISEKNEEENSSTNNSFELQDIINLSHPSKFRANFIKLQKDSK